VELAAGCDVPPGRLKDTGGPKVAQLPLVGASKLAFDLMRLDHGRAMNGEFDTLSDLTERLDGYGLRASCEYL
jgi:hypothetical protein